MPSASNVSVGKPKVAGAIYYAAAGTTLPTDATTALAGAFTELGYVSEDGVTNSMAIDSDNLYAWGGDLVCPIKTGFTDTFTFTLIESLNVDVLKAIFGSTNVTGTLSNGISVNINDKYLTAQVWVVELVLKGSHVKRIVIPSGTITEFGDVVYKDDEAIGYEITITCSADSSGNPHYEYLK